MKQTLLSVRKAWIEHNSPLFRAGLLLLVINPVIGWIGAPVTAALVSLRHEPRTGIIAAAAVYGFSWVLLGLGLFLAGKPGYRMSRQILKGIRGRVKRRTLSRLKKRSREDEQGR